MRRHSQSGFTLIEVMIVLAIASLLVPIVFNGQRQIRSRAQFADGVERLRSTLVSIKNEANTTVNTRSGAGTSTTVVAAGRMITIDNSSPAGSLRLTVTPILLVESVIPTVVSYDNLSIYTVDIPWGVKVNIPTSPATMYLAFLRNDDNGRLKTYFPALASPASVSAFGVPSTPLTINLTDPDSHIATVVVDPASGTVTRTIK